MQRPSKLITYSAENLVRQFEYSKGVVRGMAFAKVTFALKSHNYIVRHCYFNRWKKITKEPTLPYFSEILSDANVGMEGEELVSYRTPIFSP